MMKIFEKYLMHYNKKNFKSKFIILMNLERSKPEKDIEKHK